MTKDIDGVICYWKWANPPKKGIGHRVWEFVEAYAIDDDGYPLTLPKNTGKGSHEWQHWTDVEDADDLEPIMGRAVTIWTFESGTKLLDLHPPEWSPWLSVGFIERIKNLPNWSSFLEGGHELFLYTAAEAKKIILRHK